MLVRQQPNRQRLRLSAVCRRRIQSSRLICVSFAALLIAVSVLSLSPGPVQADGVAHIDTDVLNLRDGPGTWANVVTKMWQGEAVDIYSGPTDDGWYEVAITASGVGPTADISRSTAMAVGPTIRVVAIAVGLVGLESRLGSIPIA